MSEYRWEALARLDGMTASLVGGGCLQLVTVCLSDEGAGELSDEQGRAVAGAPPVVCHLRPSEARELAFCLLELAELADRGSQVQR